MITTTEEAIAYLRPIADSATLNNYQQALRIAIKAMEDSARASARDLITNADRIRAMTDDQLADVERLTTRCAGYAVMAWEHEEQHTTQEWIDMLTDRLAAYEDTGFSPTDFDMLCREMSNIRLRLGIKTFQQLLALVKADAEGRLVVLPCKLGTKVYKISSRLNGNHEIVKTWFSLTYIKPDDFGKTVFLTREEAEAALMGGKENG